jgi:peroxin-6
MIIIGTTIDPEKLPRAVRGCFRHEMRIDAPDEDERRAILRDVTKGTPLAPDVRLETLSLQTAALNARDLKDMVGRAAFEALRRAAGQTSEAPVDGIAATSEEDSFAAGVCVSAKDFELALERSRKEHADSIGAPKVGSCANLSSLAYGSE